MTQFPTELVDFLAQNNNSMCQVILGNSNPKKCILFFYVLDLPVVLLTRGAPCWFVLP